MKKTKSRESGKSNTAIMNKRRRKGLLSILSEAIRKVSLNTYNEGSLSVIIIENVNPEIDGGTFYAKGLCGEKFKVSADIYKEGTDLIRAVLKYKKSSDSHWNEVSMYPTGNDSFESSFIPDENAKYLYTIEAWADPVTTWIEWMSRKKDSLSGYAQEGILLFEEIKKSMERSYKHLSSSKSFTKINSVIDQLRYSSGDQNEILNIITDPALKEIVQKYPLKQGVTGYAKTLELFVDRKLAGFSAWYEIFPRSQNVGLTHQTPSVELPLQRIAEEKTATFIDCIKSLPYIKAMGFDVVYLTPIHPIGFTKRKGKNNNLVADYDSPGSPWAIGNATGGHKSIHPELGTLDDFRSFVAATEELGMEIALDFAIQCSPDHPYVKEHPEWFYRMPDGTVKYAENPPKKYEDIYPLNFYCKADQRKALWAELKSVVLFWIKQGVKIFRVDNPHTKPFAFWKWLIDEVKKDHPEVIFLSEAFTRPKVMKYLAKIGFTQSYTYFTWRNSKAELKEYLTELTQTDMKYYFRSNFFANTPDILSPILQSGGLPAFKMRLVLAAILSPNYGIYSGYEFGENSPREEGSEEYLNSEKYEIKVRDLDKQPNIKDFIGKINQIRRENQALQKYANLEFYETHNDNILCFGKRTEDNSNIIVVIVNLDPFNAHEDTVTLPLHKFGMSNSNHYQMHDLLNGEKYQWYGASSYVRLDPCKEPAHIFLLQEL